MKRELEEVRNAKCPITRRICGECTLVTVLNENNKKQRKPRCEITGKYIESKSGCPKLNPEMFEQPGEEEKAKVEKVLSDTACPVTGGECEFFSIRSRQRSDGVDGQFKYCMKSNKQLRSNTLCPLKKTEKTETLEKAPVKKSLPEKAQDVMPAKGEEEKRKKMHEAYYQTRIEKLKNEIKILGKANKDFEERSKEAEEENLKLVAEVKSTKNIMGFQKQQIKELKDQLDKAKVVTVAEETERDQVEINKLGNAIAESELQVHKLQDENKHSKENEEKAIALAKHHDERNMELILELDAAHEQIRKLENELQTPAELEEVRVERTDRVDKVIDVLHALLA
jgi:chromosome segregation ATPase